MKHHQKWPLTKWIWSSFIRTALIPLLVVELLFIGMYFVTYEWSKRTTVDSLREEAHQDLQQMASREGEVIANQIQSISNSTNLYRKQVAKALEVPAQLSPEDENRLGYSSKGVYYSKSNLDNDGAAVYYSAIRTAAKHDKEKVAQLLSTQSLMKDIYETHLLASAVYMNTYDSLNIIYPYFDVLDQYSASMYIPQYNFYFKANEEYNPSRGVVWTDAYLDPAGKGWIASSIAPVYNRGFLEGVVGIDVTISNIANNVLDLNIPWSGFGMLIEEDGTILALPKQGEEVFGITELNEHTYQSAVMKNTLKPDKFNMFKRKETQHIASIMDGKKNGMTKANLNNEQQLVVWSTIPETGWKLMAVVKENNIYKNISTVNSHLIKIGVLMIAGLLIVYLLYFLYLYRKTHKMSNQISEPLVEMNEMVDDIGKGNYFQSQKSFSIIELDKISNSITAMGHNLGSAYKELESAQSKVEDKESDLRALISSIDDIIMRIDSDGRYINIWTSDEQKLTRPKDELFRSSIQEVFPKEDADLFMSTIKEVDRTKQSKNLEYYIQTMSGYRWFQGRLSPIYGTDDQQKHFVLSVRDITDLKELQESLRHAKEEAERASAAKSDFLSSMSHELRTPMNAILGFAQLLEFDADESLTESQLENVEEIIKAGNHLLTLINEILDLAKIESGKLTVSIEPVEIAPVVEEVMSITQPLADRREITLDQSIEPYESTYVYADRTRLKQVLLNLLSNAVKYNEDRGKIRFSCYTQNDHMQFIVEDSGFGIEEEEIQHIFEPFTRVKEDSPIEGTGIGLTLTKQLVAMMNGTISVKSQVGKGSTFWVELPLVEEVEGINQGVSAAINEEPFSFVNKKKLLYIEDNPANLHLVQKILRKYDDIELFSAVNGEIGIDLAQAHEPDLILLDLNLPGIDGYEVLEKLRGIHETKNITIVAISANAMPRDVEKGLAAGFQDYMTKPLQVSKFSQMIHKYMYKDD
ncbi:ATP-binding protein [Pontibacillus yanchengensis]|uniref:histidine kinase n=1 Tax=Pontibacillus yanchengensis Y32 TaxID=1385514 RepID=A0A0A2TF52_9BACI|nr:ATP-binding protein [Pontibacillus yanchengensis]KGP72741.1 histidine kinase [Pontibacillus yanchengensis Y32]